MTSRRTLRLLLGFGIGFGGALLCGCHRSHTDPKAPALAYYQALARQDWKAMYPLTAFAPEEREVYKDADDFAQKVEHQLGEDTQGKGGFEDLSGLSDLSVGEPILHGDKANVPTSATLHIGTRTVRLHGMAHMIDESGVWKFDTTASGPNVAALQILQLIGKPEPPSGPAQKQNSR